MINGTDWSYASLSSIRSDQQLEFSVASVFEQFGRVYVKIRRDPKGMPYAFAQYEVRYHPADTTTTGPSYF